MKFSKYVKKIDFDSQNYLLRNLYNGAIYVISKLDYQQIEEALKNGANIMERHREALLCELFIVEGDPVPQYIRQSDTFLVTIETTSNCNLQCSYCYEKDKGSRPDISESVISDVLLYIENVFIRDASQKELCVGFIGGEPLLCKETVYSICNEVVDIGRKHGRHIGFHIDTNGTVPFDDLYSSLDNLHVSVSLTPHADHNKNRSGRRFDSFNRIVSNLKQIPSKSGNSLSIRYNTNEENINQFADFVSFVRENIPICSAIEPMYTDEYEHTDFKNLLDPDSFRKWNSSEAIDILISYGYHIPYSLGGTLAPCIAYQKYSCKVYTDGMVALCDSMLHDDSRCCISDICQHPELLDDFFADFKRYNPLKDRECRECIELPRCMGKLFCRTEKCNHNKRFDDDLLAYTFTKYFLEQKGSYFIGML